MAIIRNIIDGITIGFGVIIGMALAIYLISYVPGLEVWFKDSLEVIKQWVA